MSEVLRIEAPQCFTEGELQSIHSKPLDYEEGKFYEKLKSVMREVTCVENSNGDGIVLWAAKNEAKAKETLYRRYMVEVRLGEVIQPIWVANAVSLAELLRHLKGLTSFLRTKKTPPLADGEPDDEPRPAYIEGGYRG